MTHAEFVAWREFYREFPFDDLHRIYRPAAMIAQAMSGGEIAARLQWLQPDRMMANSTDADMNTLKAFGFTRKGD